MHFKTKVLLERHTNKYMENLMSESFSRETHHNLSHPKIRIITFHACYIQYRAFQVLMKRSLVIGRGIFFEGGWTIFQFGFRGVDRFPQAEK